MHVYASVCVVGLMSVFAQQIEYLSSALRVLDSSNDNQYGIRGQPRFDKVLSVPSEGAGRGVSCLIIQWSEHAQC